LSGPTGAAKLTAGNFSLLVERDGLIEFRFQPLNFTLRWLGVKLRPP